MASALRRQVEPAFALLCLLTVAAANARELRVSAQIDKSQVNVGDAVTLTLTVEGDLKDTQLKPAQFPDGLAVVAQGRSSNFSFQSGQIRQSTSVTYALVPLREGTFQLGPFEFVHRGHNILTDPVSMTATKPSLPPHLQETPRYSL